VTRDETVVVPAGWLIGQYRQLIADAWTAVAEGRTFELPLVLARAQVLDQLTPAFKIAGNATTVAADQADGLASVSEFPARGEGFDDASGPSPHPRHDGKEPA